MKTLHIILILLMTHIKVDDVYGQTPWIKIVDESYNQTQMIVQVICFDCDINDTVEIQFALENHDSNSTYFYTNTFEYTGNYTLGYDTLTFFHPTYIHDLKILNGKHYKVNQSWMLSHYFENFDINNQYSPYFDNGVISYGFYQDSITNNWVYGGYYSSRIGYAIGYNMDSIFLDADYIGVEVDFMRYSPDGNGDSNAIRVIHLSSGNAVLQPYPNDYNYTYTFSIPEDSILHVKQLINSDDFGGVYFGKRFNLSSTLPTTTYFDNIRLYPVYDKYICVGDGLEVNGVFQYEEGVYIDSLLTVLGTDSIIGINLKHNTLVYGDTIFATICENDTYNLYDTLPISNPGLFTFLTTTLQGCDSIFFLDLTLQENNILTDITSSNNVLSYNDPQSGYTYQWIDVNSNQPISGETSSTFTPSANGTYAVDVSNGICTQRSNSSHTNLEIKEWSNQISISPNPFSNQINITLEEVKPEVSVYITDIQSKLVFKKTYTNVTTIQINGNLFKNGIYQLTLNDGVHAITKHIIRLQ